MFGHGAKDARWAEPMRRLKERLAQSVPDVPVALAFLELMQPDLASAAATMVDAGCDRIAIVPVFLGQGGHVRRDLAALIETLRSQYPDVDVSCAAAVGEDEAVLDALAAYCTKSVVAITDGPLEAI